MIFRLFVFYIQKGYFMYLFDHAHQNATTNLLGL